MTQKQAPLSTKTTNQAIQFRIDSAVTEEDESLSSSFDEEKEPVKKK